MEKFSYLAFETYFLKEGLVVPYLRENAKSLGITEGYPVYGDLAQAVCKLKESNHKVAETVAQRIKDANKDKVVRAFSLTTTDTGFEKPKNSSLHERILCFVNTERGANIVGDLEKIDGVINTYVTEGIFGTAIEAGARNIDLLRQLYEWQLRKVNGIMDMRKLHIKADGFIVDENGNPQDLIF